MKIVQMLNDMMGGRMYEKTKRLAENDPKMNSTMHWMCNEQHHIPSATEQHLTRNESSSINSFIHFFIKELI